MCRSPNGLDHLRKHLPDNLKGFIELDRSIVLSLMDVGINPIEISFYSGLELGEVKELINSVEGYQ